jgi:hypothetical protein
VPLSDADGSDAGVGVSLRDVACYLYSAQAEQPLSAFWFHDGALSLVMSCPSHIRSSALICVQLYSCSCLNVHPVAFSIACAGAHSSASATTVADRRDILLELYKQGEGTQTEHPNAPPYGRAPPGEARQKSPRAFPQRAPSRVKKGCKAPAWG